MAVDRNGPDCNCGNIGCLEVMASGSAIAQFARQRLRGGEESTMATEGDIHTIDAEIVANAARSGDNLAKEIISMAASNLGRGIVNIMHGLDPDIVILGGGLTKNLDLFMPTIIGEISNHAIKYQVETIPLVRSTLGDNISLLGASALAFTYYGKSDIKLQR
jgi:glucokinase